MCLSCVVSAWLGSMAANYLGIELVEHPTGKKIIAVATPILVMITIIALSVLFDLTLCIKGAHRFVNVVLLFIEGGILSSTYAIGLNMILKRYVFPELPPSCCQGMS